MSRSNLSTFVTIVVRLESLVKRVRNVVPLHWILFASVFVLSVASFWLSYEIRFEFNVPAGEASHRAWMTLFASSLKLVLFYLVGGHAISWRYAGLKDALVFILHSMVASGVIYVVSAYLPYLRVPRSVILVDFFVTLLFIGGSRLLLRLAREKLRAMDKAPEFSREQRAIIIGAGDAGEMLSREILRNRVSKFRLVAFFDDNAGKKGVTIHGVRVVGPVDAVPEFVERNRVDVVIVAIPSLGTRGFGRIYDILKPLGVLVKTLPSMTEILKGAPALVQLRDISIEDLLGRDEIRIDMAEVNALVSGRTVLVTGAGGSIGSELCRQILRKSPESLILVERSENGLFHIHRELAALHGVDRVVPVLCDVSDATQIFRVFTRFKPDLVYHAAAHKHVPMQELYPAECFRNNIGGTIAAAKAADLCGVERFIMISTDKAVNPTSVMGATKRVCELYCQAMGNLTRTQFMSVRFGNVLASEGSVVPVFMEQIARGGPVTVTHPEMQRYFMTIPEAVLLVLQASVLGKSGQVMFLDMGTPLRILDLVDKLIELSGKRADEVPVEFIGMRPGEKLFEELICTDETCLHTTHEKIKVCKINGDGYLLGMAVRIEKELAAVVETGDPYHARRVLKALVPEYDCPK